MTTNKTKENTNNKNKTKKTKKKLSVASIILIVGCVLILIPFIILGVILLQASSERGEPIVGSRFDGDLNPAITQADIDRVLTDCDMITDVQGCSVNLKTATFRLYIDADDSVTKEQAIEIAQKGFNLITGKLDVDTYFTSSSTKKMYDIEVHVYNSLDKIDTDEYVYVIENKSSNMVSSNVQVVSEALNEELAQQLRDDVENRKNPKPSEDTEIELGDGETEDTQGGQ